MKSVEEQGIEQSILSFRLPPTKEVCHRETLIVAERGDAQSKVGVLRLVSDMLSFPAFLVCPEVSETTLQGKQ